MSEKIIDDTLTIHQRKPLHLLSPDIAERIAAGEVIERPVSVAKELIENALDAHAREILVEVRGGGLRLLRVTDDGDGIPASELPDVCLRHTTSKITVFDDLNHLHTLGFRGEALASIAAVAEVTILSRTIESEMEGQDNPGAWITVRGSELVDSGRRARLHGTTITVRDLFYNVPARLAYVSGTRTENSHFVQLLQHYAIGYPAIRFRLLIDERELVQTSGSNNIVTALAEIYHLSLDTMLYPVQASDDIHYTLTGYIGNRVLLQNNRQHISFFINGRLIQSRLIQEALEQGYRHLLPRGKHPLIVLHLQVPPAEIDVNVHPAKQDVHLLHEKLITQILTQTLQTLLARSPATPEEYTLPGPVITTQRRLPGIRRQGLHVAETADGYHADEALPGTAAVITRLQPLAQLQQAVILAEAPDGSLYLIDQHRAHERIIYEHLQRTTASADRKKDSVRSHLLLEPVLIEMKRNQAELLEQRLPVLQDFGIECERFGGRSFLVRSIPAGEGNEQLPAHLQEIVEVAATDNADWKDHLLISLACRSALRRGRVLSAGEQRHLLQTLATVAAPAVCPHGSPILLHYSRTFLIDRFDW